MEIMNFLTEGLFYGLCYGIAAIGLSFPLKFLNSADFTSIGSYMLGGILSIYFANLTSFWLFGLMVGSLLTGCLGVITTFLALNKTLKLGLMLSSIVVFTAARSFGLMFAGNGKIAIDEIIAPFSSTFSWTDIIILLLFALCFMIMFHALARSKYGCLAFGLCSNNRFKEFRHPLSNSTTYWLMFIANFLVGLSGGLASFKMGNAFAEIELEFLSMAFGAIFSGSAFVGLTIALINKKAPADIHIEFDDRDKHEQDSGFWEKFQLKLSPQRDDSERIWYIILSYFVSAIILNDISTAVAAQKLFEISPAYEHLIVASLIVGGLFISNLIQKKREVVNGV